MTGELNDLQHPWFARFYLRISQAAERHGAAEHRDQLLEDLSGRVIEVGAGNGLMFAHYPHSVTEVLAVEPDDVLRAQAEAAAERAPVPVTVVTGHADALPSDDGSFDAAVLALVLCSVPSQARSLTEVRRVLRPGGELRFYEHVRSSGHIAGRVQDAITPAWAWAFGGCHPNRDTLPAIQAAGFDVVAGSRFSFGPGRLAPRSAHILGRASARPTPG